MVFFSVNKKVKSNYFNVLEFNRKTAFAINSFPFSQKDRNNGLSTYKRYSHYQKILHQA